MIKLIALLFIVLTNCFITIQSFHHLHIRYYNRIINKHNLQLNAGKPVSVSFEPSGKSIIAEQNELISDVAKKAGVTIPFGCKQGRCNSCEVRLNGRVSAKVCQGAKIPSGPTKNLIITVINKQPLK